MPEQKPRQKSRASKTSQHTARGARRTRLTELQKILIGNGGMGHTVLRRRGHMTRAKRRPLED